MEPHAAPPRGAPQPSGIGDHPGWWAAFLGLLLAQGWLTLGLFGTDHSFDSLSDARPVLSGRHPLHLYHGCLGARSLCARGTPSCFDPAFQAGYPKTPVFDDGSRPAEALLVWVGGAYRPDVYKWGLAGVCLAAPGLAVLAARAAGLSRLRACLAGALGLLVWWGRPCRELLEAGEASLPAAALLAAAHFGLLVRYHRAPGPLALAGAALAAALAWFAHPALMLLTLPLFLIYYFTVGGRHPFAWHVGLAAGLAAALGANAFWLPDWVGYWWLRTPPALTAPAWTGHALRALWEAPAWGEPADRTAGLFLTAAALPGAWLLHRRGRRPAALVFGLGSFGLLLPAAGAAAWGELARLGAGRLLVPALLFALAPAANGLTEALRPVSRWLGWAGAGVAGLGLLAALTLAAPSHRAAWVERARAGAPLALGLGAEREAVVAALRERTTAEGRVLWEDRRGAHWPALLPLLTGRSFVGGLDPDAGIEHTAGGLADGALCGKSLDDWADDELSDYCERYNIKWVVCWSPRAAERFVRWPGAEADAAALSDGGDGRLFTLKRTPAVALRGSARCLTADAGRIVLTDVTPAGGEVVLSLHYQSGLRATPSRVRVERHADPREAVPFVRLVLDEPAPVVTLTWEKR
jgi:hypothetical protein